jgi:serine/threonine protein kinase
MKDPISSAKTENISARMPATRKEGTGEEDSSLQPTRKAPVDLKAGTAAPGTAKAPEASAVESKTALPKLIGGYEILQELGRGGMGIVYKANDSRLKRTVALKMIWAGSSANADELVRFRGEAEMVAQLQHPNIVQIYEIGMHDSQPFIVFEFVDGGNLADRIQGKPQAPRQAAEMIETLARAISLAHQQHIIHRDLKPANVLLTRTGVLKITDFGLAKQLGHSLGLSRTGDVMGTPSYMSPEQAAGQLNNLGPATDIYSLGAILYELLTGRPPFRGVTMFETLEQVRSAEPAPLSKLVPKLHRDLGTICLKCLQKNPTKRYHSALELAEDLRRWLEGDVIRARPVTRWEKVWRSVRRHPWQTAAALASILMLIAVALLGLSYREQTLNQELHQEKSRREEEQKAAQAKYLRVQEEKEAELRKQHNLMQQAMDKILTLVHEDGPLSRQGGLDPLYAELLVFYEKLILQQEENKYADFPKLAQACFTLGELLSRGGKNDKAFGAYAKARREYERLAQSPEPEQVSQQLHYRHQVARTYLQEGRLRYNLGEITLAQKAADIACQQLTTLGVAGDNADCLRDLAEAHHLKAEMLHTYERRYQEALHQYVQARRFRRQLCNRRTTEQPPPAKNLRDLARSYGYEGDVRLDLFDFQGADRAYWNSHRLREDLARSDPKDPERQFQLARSFTNFANYQLRLRSPQTATYFFEQACRLQEKILEENRGVLEYESDLLGTYNRLLELLLHAADQPDTPGKENLRSEADAVARKIRDRLRKHDPEWDEGENRSADAARLPTPLPDKNTTAKRKPAEETPVLPLWNLQRNVTEAYLLLSLHCIEERPQAALRHRLRAGQHLAVLRRLRPQDRPDPYLEYLDAALWAQRYESALRREERGEGKADEKLAADAIARLQQAFQNDLFRRKHSLDVQQERAFRSLRDVTGFRTCLQEFVKKREEAEADARRKSSESDKAKLGELVRWVW